jgi:hypothetical protein
VQQDILVAAGLGFFGFIERDFRKFFLQLSPSTPIEIVREKTAPLLVDAIAKAVDIGRATTGLRIEKLVDKHNKLRESVDRIFEIRKTEIQETSIGVRGNEVDLRELWLTTYGYDILNALEMNLTTDLTGFEHVKRAFEELGHELKIGDSSISGVNMSGAMKDCIWWIAKNRGKKWSEIKS